MNSKLLVMVGKDGGVQSAVQKPYEKLTFGEDGYRAQQLPLDVNDSMTTAVGLAIDFTATDPVRSEGTSGDGDALSAGPRTIVLGSDGRLTIFNLANKFHNQATADHSGEFYAFVPRALRHALLYFDVYILVKSPLS